MLTTIKITLPLPHKDLSPNGRAHWAAKARQVKKHRGWAHLETVSQRSRNAHKKPWERAALTATFYFKCRRKRDGGNANDSLKAYIDGVVDGGLLADDNSDILTVEPPRFAIDRDSPRVELVFRKEE